jgi:hypothetical protein
MILRTRVHFASDRFGITPPSPDWRWGPQRGVAVKHEGTKRVHLGFGVRGAVQQYGVGSTSARGISRADRASDLAGCVGAPAPPTAELGPVSSYGSAAEARL